MTSPEVVRDRAVLERALGRHRALHLYEIGDLDDAFFPHTTYFVERGSSGDIEAVALLYDGGDLPTLVALAGDEREQRALERMIPRVLRAVARPVYAHFSPSLRPTVSAIARVEPRGHHKKLVWTDRQSTDAAASATAERLAPGAGAEVLALLDAEYPGHFFHPRVLETGMAFGVRDAGRLVAFAGVHVYSARYRVVALGNVVTASTHRGRGLAVATCGALCRAVHETADPVGLNVDAENAAALRCYEKLGFTFVANYDEAVLFPEPSTPARET